MHLQCPRTRCENKYLLAFPLFLYERNKSLPPISSFRLTHGKGNSIFIYPLSTCSEKKYFCPFLRKKNQCRLINITAHNALVY